MTLLDYLQSLKEKNWEHVQIVQAHQSSSFNQASSLFGQVVSIDALIEELKNAEAYRELASIEKE